MIRLRYLIMGALGCVSAVSIAGAAVVPLSDLLQDGATITSGDKIFSNFNYGITGDMPAADAVNIETIQDEFGNHGIRIQAGFTDVAGGSSSDAIVEFDVTVAPGAPLINDVHLRANPAVINGEGLASITETFLPTIDDDKLVVWDFGNGEDQLSDSLVFDTGYQTLSVQKDIILHATGDNSAVTLSFVDQTFSVVPEPASGALFLVGLMSLATLRRKFA